MYAYDIQFVQPVRQYNVMYSLSGSTMSCTCAWALEAGRGVGKARVWAVSVTRPGYQLHTFEREYILRHRMHDVHGHGTYRGVGNRAHDVRRMTSSKKLA